MNMLEEFVSDTFDIELGLKDAFDDTTQQPSRRILAALSIGMPPGDAFHAARELHNAVQLIVGGTRRGRIKLAEILGARCDDYQRALWYAVAGRNHFGVLSDLGWLVEQLDARLKVAIEMSNNGLSVVTDDAPYACDGPCGPIGVFTSDFDVSAFDMLSDS
jgi:hypothetical protein